MIPPLSVQGARVNLHRIASQFLELLPLTLLLQLPPLLQLPLLLELLRPLLLHLALLPLLPPPLSLLLGPLPLPFSLGFLVMHLQRVAHDLLP